MDIKFNVEVEDLDLASAIPAHYDADDDRIPSGTLADLVVRHLVDRAASTTEYKQSITDRVRAIRDEEIRAQLSPIIADALIKPLKKTNSYGEATGPETTLRELISADVKKFLSEKDDRYRDTRTRLETMIRNAVETLFKNEIAQAVKDAKDAVAVEMGSKVAEVVASAVRDAMKAR